jgi:hypothetical protein
LATRRTRTRVIGGYDSTREGGNLRGLSLYTLKLFYFTHLGILERKRGLHELLGGIPHYDFDI